MYEGNECVPVDYVYVLVEMWPPLRSIVTSSKLIVVVEIFEVKMVLLCCLSMLLIKWCRRSKP